MIFRYLLFATKRKQYSDDITKIIIFCEHLFFYSKIGYLEQLVTVVLTTSTLYSEIIFAGWHRFQYQGQFLVSSGIVDNIQFRDILKQILTCWLIQSISQVWEKYYEDITIIWNVIFWKFYSLMVKFVTSRVTVQKYRKCVLESVKTTENLIFNSAVIII